MLNCMFEWFELASVCQQVARVSRFYAGPEILPHVQQNAWKCHNCFD